VLIQVENKIVIGWFPSAANL